MLGTMMDTPLLITEIMRFGERNFPHGEIVSVTLDNPRHRTTYGEVFRRARKLANALQAAGVKPGDRVATLAWNDYRHLELYYAVSCMGAVLHTVNPRLFPEQLEYIINHAEDRLLFIDPTLLPVLAPLQGKLPTVERVDRDDERRGHAGRGQGQAARLRVVHRAAAGRVRLARARRAHREFALLHLGHHRQPEGRALQPPLERAARLRRLHGGLDGPVRPRLRARGRADVPRQLRGASPTTRR